MSLAALEYRTLSGSAEVPATGATFFLPRHPASSVALNATRQIVRPCFNFFLFSGRLRLFVPAPRRRVASWRARLPRHREYEKWRFRRPEFRHRLEPDPPRSPERLPHRLRSGKNDYSSLESVLV